MEKLYPESGVELNEFTAKNYDWLMNLLSLGFYSKFIRNAIKNMNIKPNDKILDFGCGTGKNASLMLNYLGKKGKILGIDISKIMQNKFNKRFKKEPRVSFLRQRIDKLFKLDEKFDIVFISFVIHGFPNKIREIIIENAKRNLKSSGRFIILDFAEFDLNKMPWLYKFIFKKIECPYAFDYIKRNWKKILSKKGFEVEYEKFYFKGYVRLLSARKKYSKLNKTEVKK